MMATKVFINLPVKDIEKSKFFFSNLGFHINDQISDELAICISFSENIFVMLLTEDYFKSFTRKNIADTKAFSEVIISLEAKSKQEIQNIIKKAKQLGAHIYTEAEDYAWLYQHSFADLDGHHWEFIFIDKKLLPS